MESYTINKNHEFNSLEISFSGKPSEAIRDTLKALRFRWHGVKKVWYGYQDEETVKQALENASTGKAEKPAAKAAEKVNKYGVKVGDLFSASWGYEQTNVDYFQVIALCGEESVRVREVQMKVIRQDAVGPMSCDYTYELTSEILPPVSSSVFIKDQEKGDLKRIRDYSKDGSGVHFSISSFANAYKETGTESKHYVSWYA